MFKICIAFVLLLTNSFFFTVFGQDMRADHQEAYRQKKELLEKARMESAAAKKSASRRQQQIVTDRSALLKAIKGLEAQNEKLKNEVTVFDATILNLKQDEERLRVKLKETEGINKEISGFVRGNAKDLYTLLNQSLQSALKPEREETILPFIDQMLNQAGFPSMENIQLMVDVLFEEISLSGAVNLTEGMIVDRKGLEVKAKLLVLGNFTAMYALPDETGFLLFSDQSKRLFALSKLPERRRVRSRITRDSLLSTYHLNV